MSIHLNSRNVEQNSFPNFPEEEDLELQAALQESLRLEEPQASSSSPFLNDQDFRVLNERISKLTTDRLSGGEKGKISVRHFEQRITSYIMHLSPAIFKLLFRASLEYQEGSSEKAEQILNQGRIELEKAGFNEELINYFSEKWNEALALLTGNPQADFKFLSESIQKPLADCINRMKKIAEEDDQIAGNYGFKPSHEKAEQVFSRFETLLSQVDTKLQSLTENSTSKRVHFPEPVEVRAKALEAIEQKDVTEFKQLMQGLDEAARARLIKEIDKQYQSAENQALNPRGRALNGLMKSEILQGKKPITDFLSERLAKEVIRTFFSENVSSDKGKEEDLG